MAQFIKVLLISILTRRCVYAVISYGTFNSSNAVTTLTNVVPTNVNKYFWKATNETITTTTITNKAILRYANGNLVENPPLSSHILKGRRSTIDPFFERFSKIFLDSKHCREMQTCQAKDSVFETFPEKSCYCDELCNILNDCCVNFSPPIKLPFKKQQFSCINYDGFNHGIKGYGVFMIISCSEHWKHERIRSLCGNADGNILSQTPVIDKSKYRLTYRNMYCAQCNFVYDFEYWSTDIKCLNNKTDISDCEMRHNVPTNRYVRLCETNIISNCNTIANNIPLKNCTNGPYSLVYKPFYNRVYKNINCAMCDRYKDGEMYCKRLNTTIPTAKPHFYSFRLLVDLNAGSESKICKDSEIFDPFSQTCRSIYCAPPSFPSNGACAVVNLGDTTVGYDNSSINLHANCTLVKIKLDEYKIFNVSQVLLLHNEVILDKDNFQMVGNDMFVCRDIMIKCYSSDCKDTLLFFDFTKLERYITLIGMTISIVCLAVTFLIYVCIPKLLNIHGKNLVCLAGTLLLSHALFLLSSQAESIPKLCKMIAILMHYLYLSSFTWMNVIAFEFCKTFSNKFLLVNRNRNIRRFIWYSIYAWCTPMVIVLVSVSFEFADLGPTLSSLKPGYGNGICWITSSRASLLFVGGPFGLLKLFDIIAFSFTMVYICQARRIGAKTSRKNDTCTCLINLKLSLIMGITWILAFIANLSNSMPMWYMYIAFNSLQGLFIAICFLCSKSVCLQIREKIRRGSASFTHSAT